MHKLIPILCAVICVAFIGAMTTHGGSDLRHDLSHAVPGQGDGIGHDHGDLPDEATEVAVGPVGFEVASGTLPVGHHHHSGGDSHAALLDHQGGVSGLVSADAPSTTLGSNRLPEGLFSDRPEHPPKQLHLIA